MDQDTRNKLQRATQQVRRILEEEFAEQLEGTFDVLPNGKILPTPGKHLDARQRLTRQKLVDAIEHIKAGGKTPREAVEEYTREAAFTFLNRFVALRMLEARGMLQECVSRGDASGGFKEFCGLAPGLSSLDDGGYRLYLECLFDELTIEVKVLFDRRDPTSLLWPRRGALNELLETLGQTDLEDVWIEDETIGWVYQYFNSGEERKKMREESQAPRNSRELAVRNQFFTPRYVVEFLTDNTLGRIWYEMRKGNTRLVKECPYLVRRPSEVFLDEGQEPPADDSEAEQNLSRAELLKKTVYIQHQVKKDPRDLKILDPACGSGHFLLYAFDLLITIYDEAWHDEASSKSEITGQRLRDDYTELRQLHMALPGLVLAHNLHGIDIDPRAAQIAALALWMRGQRAFNEYQISREQRPVIARSNIVCAEPMPGEAAFLDEFISEHLSNDAEGRFLAGLVRNVFEAMRLAGEAGSLLKIEEDIAEEVAKAKKKWLDRPQYKQQTLFDDDPKARQKELELTLGITDESFWEEAEQRIYEALRSYSEKAEPNDGYQRRLFAADAGRGFALIDLFRICYDVILMNPPFGDGCVATRSYLKQRYKSGAHDVCAAFVLRAMDGLTKSGRVGAITNRNALFIQTFAEWRRRVAKGGGFELVADFGYGVLDAKVETACYVIASNVVGGQCGFLNLLGDSDKGSALYARTQSGGSGVDRRSVSSFDGIPGAPLAYWVPDSMVRRFSSHGSFNVLGGNIGPGLQTGDDFRFLRLRWEVSKQGINTSSPQEDREFTHHRWAPIAKGGEYSMWWDDIHLLVNWHRNGFEVCNFVNQQGKLRSRPQNVSSYFTCGGTFPYRTTSGFGMRLLPPGCVFSVGGWGVFAPLPFEWQDTLAIFNSRIARYFMEVLLGQGDSSTSGSMARNHGTEAVGGIPWPSGALAPKDRDRVVELVKLTESLDRDETEWFFHDSDLTTEDLGDFEDLVAKKWQSRCDLLDKMSSQVIALEESIGTLYDLTSAEECAVSAEQGDRLGSYARRDVDEEQLLTMLRMPITELTALAREHVGAKRFIQVKSYFVERMVDVASHVFKAHPSSVIVALRKVDPNEFSFADDFACSFISWLFGKAIGNSWMGGEGPGNRYLSQSLSEAADSTVLVDDVGHPDNVVTNLKSVMEQVCPITSEEVWRSLNSKVATGIRNWMRSSYFEFHINKYSKSRRKAPIYWQLATSSASYSVWIYYHRLSKDTLFQVLNEYLKPKLNHERQKLERTQSEAGAEPTRSQRKAIEDQEKFVAELAAMTEEVERIAPLWNPNLNDGVIINFAPLWRLVPQNKSWQKECKKVWDKLVKGEYDWAQLSMHLWPERVVPKCVTDASFAIAHGLEEIFWEQDDRDRLQPKEKPQGGWEPVIKRLVDERTSPAVKAALESLLNAPAPAGDSKARRRKAAK